MFQGSGRGDLRNKILFLGILVSHKRSDLLFNTADPLSATCHHQQQSRAGPSLSSSIPRSGHGGQSQGTTALLLGI